MAPATWWRDAVIYQIYPRSFADASGDGIGDIAGIRTRLSYVADLGIDAIWITPWYRSPMADHGYDVVDFRDIDPIFGTLADAEALLNDAHALGLKVLLDIVPNHTSDRHPWFQAALAAAAGSLERQRYMFHPGRGRSGELPPNDWRSGFGDSAWTRVKQRDGTLGEWYLHLFTPQQPDLNWDNPEVHAEFESILRFWFDRGVDGFRIDVAHGLIKAPGLPDVGMADGEFLRTSERPDHPHWHQDRVHEIYRAWRSIADSYTEPRVFVGEVWADRMSWLAEYVRPGRLHTAFNFDFLLAPWRAGPLREVIDETNTEMSAVGAPPTWVLSNHDVVRHLSRYSRPQPAAGRQTRAQLFAQPADLKLGLRRARAAHRFLEEKRTTA
jgi:alpha-glucosidase